MVNKDRLIRLTRRLIRINSENPPGNEYQIARLVKNELESFGFRVGLFEFANKRPNAVGILKTTKAKKSLLLSPHLDTVPAGRGWRFNPFGARLYKGKIFGRGSTDCKGNLAAGLEAIRSIIEDKKRLNYNLIFVATADEETGSKFGLIPLLKKDILRPDAALILDGESFNIVTAQKGLIHFKVKLFGKKAHGAYPGRGRNAIEIAACVIQKLKKHRFRFRRHPLLKPPTINIGTIKGGDKVNIVADWCEFEVDLRFLPGMNKSELLSQIRQKIREVNGHFKLEIEAHQAPYHIEKDHPLVKALSCAMRKIKGRAKLKGSEGATVITFFQDKGIPALATGFGASGTSHTTDEFAKIDDLYQGAKVLREFLLKNIDMG